MKKVIVFLLGLICGTGSSITSKNLLLLSFDGKLFEKPLLQTFLMFVAMLMALPIYWLLRYFGRSLPNDEYEPLPGDEVKQTVCNIPGLTRRLFFLLSIPAAFDLVATALSMMGLIYIDVSVYQLVRCAMIVTVAITRYFFLKATYSRIKKFGILINTLAVVIVGSTSFFTEGSSNHSSVLQKLLGVLVIILSCFVQSVQYVFEETVMSKEGEDGVDPLIVVALEGFWGSIFCIFLVLPLASILPGSDCSIQNGVHHCCYEDTLDSFYMISQSKSILWLTVAYIVSVLGYNVFAVHVTFFLDSVWHAILDNFRPISVWFTELMIFEIIRGGYGEEWNSSSYLQLIGLVFMFYGTAVYNGNIWEEETDSSKEQLLIKKKEQYVEIDA